jgi:hypothetical protein
MLTVPVSCVLCDTVLRGTAYSVVAQFTTHNTQFTTNEKLYKVSTRADELLQMVERGERVAGIRQALALTGDRFAERVAGVAESFGCALEFDKHKLSRVEGGTRNLTAEEAAAVVELDPDKNGVQWLVFGSATAVVRKGKEVKHITELEPVPRASKKAAKRSSGRG